jgi:hypothetical protein
MKSGLVINEKDDRQEKEPLTEVEMEEAARVAAQGEESARIAAVEKRERNLRRVCGDAVAEKLLGEAPEIGVELLEKLEEVTISWSKRFVAITQTYFNATIADLMEAGDKEQYSVLAGQLEKTLDVMNGLYLYNDARQQEVERHESVATQAKSALHVSEVSLGICKEEKQALISLGKQLTAESAVVQKKVAALEAEATERTLTTAELRDHGSRVELAGAAYARKMEKELRQRQLLVEERDEEMVNLQTKLARQSTLGAEQLDESTALVRLEKAAQDSVAAEGVVKVRWLQVADAENCSILADGVSNMEEGGLNQHAALMFYKDGEGNDVVEMVVGIDKGGSDEGSYIHHKTKEMGSKLTMALPLGRLEGEFQGVGDSTRDAVQSQVDHLWQVQNDLGDLVRRQDDEIEDVKERLTTVDDPRDGTQVSTEERLQIMFERVQDLEKNQQGMDKAVKAEAIEAHGNKGLLERLSATVRVELREAKGREEGLEKLITNVLEQLAELSRKQAEAPKQPTDLHQQPGVSSPAAAHGGVTVGFTSPAGALPAGTGAERWHQASPQGVSPVDRRGSVGDRFERESGLPEFQAENLLSQTLREHSVQQKRIVEDQARQSRFMYEGKLIFELFPWTDEGKEAKNRFKRVLQSSSGHECQNYVKAFDYLKSQQIKYAGTVDPEEAGLKETVEKFEMWASIAIGFGENEAKLGGNPDEAGQVAKEIVDRLLQEYDTAYPELAPDMQNALREADHWFHTVTTSMDQSWKEQYNMFMHFARACAKLKHPDYVGGTESAAPPGTAWTQYKNMYPMMQKVNAMFLKKVLPRDFQLKFKAKFGEAGKACTFRIEQLESWRKEEYLDNCTISLNAPWNCGVNLEWNNDSGSSLKALTGQRRVNENLFRCKNDAEILALMKCYMSAGRAGGADGAGAGTNTSGGAASAVGKQTTPGTARQVEYTKEEWEAWKKNGLPANVTGKYWPLASNEFTSNIKCPINEMHSRDHIMDKCPLGVDGSMNMCGRDIGDLETANAERYYNVASSQLKRYAHRKSRVWDKCLGLKAVEADEKFKNEIFPGLKAAHQEKYEEKATSSSVSDAGSTTSSRSSGGKGYGKGKGGKGKGGKGRRQYGGKGQPGSGAFDAAASSQPTRVVVGKPLYCSADSVTKAAEADELVSLEEWMHVHGSDEVAMINNGVEDVVGSDGQNESKAAVSTDIEAMGATGKEAAAFIVVVDSILANFEVAVWAEAYCHWKALVFKEDEGSQISLVPLWLYERIVATGYTQPLSTGEWTRVVGISGGMDISRAVEALFSFPLVYANGEGAGRAEVWLQIVAVPQWDEDYQVLLGLDALAPLEATINWRGRETLFPKLDVPATKNTAAKFARAKWIGRAGAKRQFSA